VWAAKNATTVEAIGVFSAHSSTVAAASVPKQLPVANVSATLFATLGIAPVRGRSFAPAEDFVGPDPVAVVSDSFWRRELGADPGALGRTIHVDHTAVTVIGILAPNVAFPRLGRVELFLPLAITPQQQRRATTGPACTASAA
jgi:hypothetical protein